MKSESWVYIHKICPGNLNFRIMLIQLKTERYHVSHVSNQNLKSEYQILTTELLIIKLHPDHYSQKVFWGEKNKITKLWKSQAGHILWINNVLNHSLGVWSILRPHKSGKKDSGLWEVGVPAGKWVHSGSLVKGMQISWVECRKSSVAIYGTHYQ